MPGVEDDYDAYTQVVAAERAKCDLCGRYMGVIYGFSTWHGKSSKGKCEIYHGSIELRIWQIFGVCVYCLLNVRSELRWLQKIQKTVSCLSTSLEVLPRCQKHLYLQSLRSQQLIKLHWLILFREKRLDKLATQCADCLKGLWMLDDNLSLPKSLVDRLGTTSRGKQKVCFRTGCPGVKSEIYCARAKRYRHMKICYADSFHPRYVTDLLNDLLGIPHDLHSKSRPAMLDGIEKFWGIGRLWQMYAHTEGE